MMLKVVLLSLSVLLLLTALMDSLVWLDAPAVLGDLLGPAPSPAPLSPALLHAGTPPGRVLGGTLAPALLALSALLCVSAHAARPALLLSLSRRAAASLAALSLLHALLPLACASPRAPLLVGAALYAILALLLALAVRRHQPAAPSSLAPSSSSTSSSSPPPHALWARALAILFAALGVLHLLGAHPHLRSLPLALYTHTLENTLLLDHEVHWLVDGFAMLAPVAGAFLLACSMLMSRLATSPNPRDRRAVGLAGMCLWAGMACSRFLVVAPGVPCCDCATSSASLGQLLQNCWMESAHLLLLFLLSALTLASSTRLGRSSARKSS